MKPTDRSTIMLTINVPAPVVRRRTPDLMRKAGVHLDKSRRIGRKAKHKGRDL
jgi:hypothetical protein